MAEKKYFSYDFFIIMIPVKIFLGRSCLFARLRKISYLWNRNFEVNDGERVK